MDGIISGRDQVFAVGTRTWHGKETFFEDDILWEQAYGLSGAKTARLEPVYADVNGRRVLVKDRRAVTVPGDDQPLQIVSDRYRLLDPRKAFDTLDSIVKDGHARYETAGTLKGQRIVWGLLKLTEEFKVGRNDTIQPYILLTDFRDGTGAARFGDVVTRVVCLNTHTAAMGEKGLQAFRHVNGVNERVEEAARVLGLIRQKTVETVAAYNALADFNVPLKDAKQFIADLIPLPERPSDRAKLGGYAESLARADASRLRIYSLFDAEAKGIEMAGHSAWGLFNAVTEWVDHEKQPSASADSRLYMKTLGVGANLKAEAFGKLLVLAK